MKKRRNFLLISLLLSFFILSILSFNFSSSNKTNASEESSESYAIFEQIAWNNIDYSLQTVDEPWSDELDANNVPINGYCLLIQFKEENKTLDESIIGDLCTSGRGVLAKGYNIDTMVKVNGKNIIDIEDAVCYIHPYNGLFFYFPHDSLTFDETYEYPILTLEKGIHFNDVYLPELAFGFKGELRTPNAWTLLNNKNLEKVAFTGIASNWNNIGYDATHCQSILQFGEYGENYLKKDQIANGNNLVARFADCGFKITVNGIPLWQISDAQVSYLHGFCYVYIVLPSTILTPSNGYKVTTLHIASDCEFYDSLLGEVTLYLFNDEWVIDSPFAPEDEEYDNAFSFSDIFNSEELTLDDDNSIVSGNKDVTLNTFGFFFDYKLMNKDGSFVMYLLGNSAQNGLMLFFNGNTISLYDTTKGSTLLGSNTYSSFLEDEWFSCFIYTRLVDDALNICVCIDEVSYIYITNVSLNNSANIGTNFNIYQGGGAALFRNATLGQDIKKPTINYFGKDIYGVLANSEKIDFADFCYAFDYIDGDLTDYIEIVWPNASLTNDKINKGEWDVIIKVSDKSQNVATRTIKVIAKDNLEVTVTFDGENATTYRVGDHIAKGNNPIKESDKLNSYNFVGWYFNDILWDFENDYVISDMDLTSKFEAVTIEYCLNVTIEGLTNVKSYTLYFVYGTRIDVNMFIKDGYSLKAYINDQEIENFTINDDTNIKLIYTKNNSSSGCGGTLSTSSLLLFTCSIIMLAFNLLAKAKGEK